MIQSPAELFPINELIEFKLEELQALRDSAYEDMLDVAADWADARDEGTNCHDDAAYSSLLCWNEACWQLYKAAITRKGGGA